MKTIITKLLFIVALLLPTFINCRKGTEQGEEEE